MEKEIRALNILLVFNSSYYMGASVLLYSIIKNNPCNIKVYVFYSDLTEDEIRRFTDIAAESGRAEVIFIKITETYFDQAPLHLKWITKETYYRLMAQEKLPLEVKRFLYLDIDMIVTGSLEEFYNTEFGDALLVACSMAKPDEVDTKRLEQLTLPKDTIYFNAGVLLYNLEKQREEIDVKILYEYPILFYKQLKFQDQDVLNAVFYGRVKYADYRAYNMPDYLVIKRSDVKQVYESCRIFHYNGNGKPWGEIYWGRMAELFWSYAREIPEYAPLYKACRRKQRIYKLKRKWKKFKKKFRKNGKGEQQK